MDPEDWCPDGQSWTIAALMPSWCPGKMGAVNFPSYGVFDWGTG